MTGMVDNLRSTLVLFALLFTSRTTMLSKTEIFQTLRTPVSLDAYLLDIAKREKNHQFLGKATQGAYLALIQLLKRYFETKERAPSDIRVLDWGTGKGHISYLLKKDLVVLQNYKNHVTRGDIIALCMPVYYEIMRGLLKMMESRSYSNSIMRSFQLWH